MLDVAQFMGCSFNITLYYKDGIQGLWDRFCIEFLESLAPRKYHFELREESPEIYGEWSAYDFVCFAQLWGMLVNIPQCFPYRCRDIIQLCEDELGIPSDDLPPSLEIEGKHNALLGAKTVKLRYQWLMKRKTARTQHHSVPSQD